MWDLILDAVLDTLKLIPFLFVTYLLMEYLEHKTSEKTLVWVQKAGNFGPAIGAALGAVPQCGFSAAASSLYAGRVISLGTLLAIYLSTSDEMLPILISEQAPVKFILIVLAAKVALGMFWGFLTDYVLFKNENAHEHINIHSMCEEEHCNCNKGIVGSAVKHTLQIAGFILLISLGLNILIEFIGTDALAGLILNHKIFGPLITGVIGLIPNCAASVVITELYLDGALSVGSLMAGLLTSAGVGWLVLARATNSVKKTSKVVALLYAFGALSGILIGLFTPVKSSSADIYAMDTYMNLQVYGDSREEAITELTAEIERLDKLLSTGDENSDISEINSGDLEAASDETLNLIDRALDISGETDGAFNIFVYPFMEAWGFTDGNYKVPSDADLQALTEGVKNAELGKNGSKVDLGAIGKGYASDRARELLNDLGVKNALLNLGGNVVCIGTKPDGSDWTIGIQDPTGESDYVCTVKVHDTCVVTSGAYERYFEQDGKIYHHIIDPATGYPAESGLASVTIISQDGTTADALSTALYVMGYDKAVEFYKSGKENFECILVTDAGEIFITEGLWKITESDSKLNLINK